MRGMVAGLGELVAMSRCTRCAFENDEEPPPQRCPQCGLALADAPEVEVKGSSVVVESGLVSMPKGFHLDQGLKVPPPSERASVDLPMPVGGKDSDQHDAAGTDEFRVPESEVEVSGFLDLPQPLRLGESAAILARARQASAADVSRSVLIGAREPKVSRVLRSSWLLAGLICLGLVTSTAAHYWAKASDRRPAAEAKPEVFRAIESRLSQDTPDAYHQAQVLCVQIGDRNCEAEASLLFDLRYGPDPVHAARAQALLRDIDTKVPRRSLRSRSSRARALALLALRSGDLEACAAALAEAGDDRRSRLYRGWLAAARGDHVAAQALARALLVDFPGDPAAALLVLESDPQATLDDHRRLADAAPEHPRIQEALVLALLSEGALLEADLRVQKLRPSRRASASFRGGALLFQALLLERRARPSRALELYDAARQRAPERQDIAVHRFRLLLATGDLAHLRREIEEMEGARLDPELAPELTSLGVELELRSGRPRAAARLVEELARRDLGGAWVPYLRGLIEREQGDITQALADFASARELAPRFVPPIIAEASILRELGRAEEGIALLARERAWAEERGARRHLLRAEVDVLLAEGRAREALEILDEALTGDPSDNDARIRRGMLRYKRGRLDAGRQDLLHVVERAGELTKLIAPLGRLYLREGAIDRARALVESRLEDRRINGDIFLLAAEIAFEGGEYSRAEALVRRYLLRDSELAWRGSLLEAKILEARGEIAEAAATVEAIDPPHPDPELELVAGRIFEANGDLERAIVRYRRAAHYQPTSVEISRRLVQALAVSEHGRLTGD